MSDERVWDPPETVAQKRKHLQRLSRAQLLEAQLGYYASENQRIIDMKSDIERLKAELEDEIARHKSTKRWREIAEANVACLQETIAKM